jgi:hypothetical protein
MSPFWMPLTKNLLQHALISFGAKKSELFRSLQDKKVLKIFVLLKINSSAFRPFITPFTNVEAANLKLVFLEVLFKEISPNNLFLIIVSFKYSIRTIS